MKQKCNLLLALLLFFCFACIYSLRLACLARLRSKAFLLRSPLAFLLRAPKAIKSLRLAKLKKHGGKRSTPSCLPPSPGMQSVAAFGRQEAKQGIFRRSLNKKLKKQAEGLRSKKSNSYARQACKQGGHASVAKKGFTYNSNRTQYLFESKKP
jgi:hypothetical protein